MSMEGVLKRVTLMGMLFTSVVTYAQGNDPQDLKPTTEATPPAGDRLVAQLGEVQTHLMKILEKARFDGDLQTALAAVVQARENLALMAALNGRLPTPTSAGPSNSPAVYLIAFKDHLIRAALGYSVEGLTFYFTTLEGT